MSLRHSILVFPGLLVLILITACNASGQRISDTQTSPLLEFLSHVPDNETYRQWVAYGDLVAWFSVWNIERPESGDLRKLESPDFNGPGTVAMVLERQTHPPQSLNSQWVFVDDQVGLFGFNIFVLDRYMEAGLPPQVVTVAEFSFDKGRIENALGKAGYESEIVEGGTLYSIRQDNEWDLEASAKSMQTPNLNRILLTDGKMVVGSGTEVVKNAQSAYSGKVQSLAENATYAAMAQAFEGEAQSDLGEMLGVVFINGTTLNEIINQRIQDSPNSQTENYFQHSLPVFELAAFATYQKDKTSFLTLALVFPKEIDAQSAADRVAERLQNYTSITSDESLGDRWTLEKAVGSTINDLSVAIVAMRAEAIEFESPLGNNLNVFTWMPLIQRQDILFLRTEPEN